MTTRRRRAAVVLLAALAGVLGALAGPTGPASAHAYLTNSSPADGTVLASAPDMIVLSFTEQVELRATHIDLADGSNRHYVPTSLTMRRPDGEDADSEAPADIVVGLPRLPADVYHLTWRTLSSDDLHITSGNLVFGVQHQVGPAAGPPGPAGPAPVETVLRTAGLLGLLVLLGGSALAGLAGRAAGLRRRLLRVAVAGGVLALVAAPALLITQVYAGTGGLPLAELSPRWIGYELGLAVLLAAVLMARTRSRPAVAVGVAAALSTAYSGALLGHTASGSATVMAASVIHVLAAGGWAGSVLAAVLALALPGTTRSADAGLLLRAFGKLAAVCVTLLAVTGLLMAGHVVATVGALLTSPYGGLLVAKLILAAGAGLLGLRTAGRLRSHRGVPAWGLIGEGIALLGVLALAAALASAGPARGPRYESVAVATTPQVSGQVADLVDAVVIRPNRPGRNVLSVTLNETRRPALAPIGGVSVVLLAPDGREVVRPVTRTGDGLWTVTTDDIDTPGTWHVSVTVLRPGLPAATDVHTWGVAGGPPPVAPAVPLEPVTTVLAVLVALGAMTGAVLLTRRRRSAAEPAMAATEVEMALSA
ncbi:copper resistance CopC/CopD family protein [Paractinoplanes durhamensis]|uniref:copper resistance CopC/CopD family protein n=1 Tax=Paractinoplanes durhamensis TaxID=113563 RepID=UPI0031CEB707